MLYMWIDTPYAGVLGISALLSSTRIQYNPVETDVARLISEGLTDRAAMLPDYNPFRCVRGRDMSLLAPT